MNSTVSKEALKKMIIKELHLEDLTPEDIDEDAPLFGEGVGLDSLDAVELVVQIQRHYGVEIRDMEEGRQAFQNINTLAEYIETEQKGAG